MSSSFCCTRFRDNLVEIRLCRMVYGRGSQYQKQKKTGGVAMDIDEKMEDLRKRIREAELGGGEKRIKEQHEKGKMTARERIDHLLDGYVKAC